MYSSALIKVKQVEKKMQYQQPSDDQGPNLMNLEIKEENRLARVVLDHKDRKNAINDKMRTSIREHLPKWVENAHIYCMLMESDDPAFFSSGGDLHEIYEAWQKGNDEALKLFRNEYETIWALECYTKPVISLINGTIMGGGIGLAQFGTHMIAGENYGWAMPEVKIGFFPDVGITHRLARMPHAIGYYLGLTGHKISREDAFYLGLVEHCIDSNHYETIREALREADPVDVVLETYHVAPEASELEATANLIESVFGAGDVKTIMERLGNCQGQDKSWAEITRAKLEESSPLSLMITHEAITRAKTLELEDVLAQDYIIAGHMLEQGDFKEGIKARMIEKRQPQWSVETVSSITTEMVNKYFSKAGKPGLDLPPRELGLDK